MRAVVQRASRAEVTIDEKETRSIGPGLVILLGVEEEDRTGDVEWLARKVSGLRIFNDDKGKMNHSVQDIKSELLIVSQFTLHASVKKGTRPSYIRAAKPATAIPLYESFIREMEKHVPGRVQTGEFGTDMQLSLTNDGPVTIWIDTKNKE